MNRVRDVNAPARNWIDELEAELLADDLAAGLIAVEDRRERGTPVTDFVFEAPQPVLPVTYYRTVVPRRRGPAPRVDWVGPAARLAHDGAALVACACLLAATLVSCLMIGGM